MKDHSENKKRDMLSAYGRVISFFSRLLGKESYYVQRLETERQRLEKKDANDTAALQKSEALLEKATETVNKLEETVSDHEYWMHVERGVIETNRSELNRRSNIGFFEGIFQAADRLFEGDYRPEIQKKSSYDLAQQNASAQAEIDKRIPLRDSAAAQHSLAESLQKGHTKTVSGLKKEMKSTDRRREMYNTSSSIAKQFEQIAKHHGTTIEKVFDKSIPQLQSLILGSFALQDIDTVILWSKKLANASPSTKPETLAALEFVNQVLIPHMDSFIVKAVVASKNPGKENPNEFDHIGEAAIFPLKTDKILEEIAKEEASPTPINRKGLDFSFLFDPSQGTHFERLSRAMALTDGQIGDFTETFKALVREIEKAVESIKISEKDLLEISGTIKQARSENRTIDRRMKEIEFMADAKLESMQRRNEVRSKTTFMQTMTYGIAKLFKGVPFLEGPTEILSETVGHPNLGNMQTWNKGNLEGAKIERESASRVLQMLDEHKADIAALERQSDKFDKGIIALREKESISIKMKDETKQRAIADAFVNKLILSYGLRVSQTIRDICDPKSIDDFLGSFKDKPRLHDALNHLAFGFADSNDLSVILAEANAIKPPLHDHSAAFKELVEDYLKPNIAAFYSHASKVDIVYQGNMTGLGNAFYDARGMIRGSHDLRVGALFGDSFGVNSEMGELSIRGALDVRNMFDFYLHRHGDRTLTDAKIRDGKVTGERVKKRLSVMDDETLKDSIQISKTARDLRQSGPDISDMFMRICGYEYFYPQAFNSAQSTNIMNNPEAPAAYIMANAVLNDFIARMSLGPIENYREKVGEKLDGLIAQTFMDFFAEVGNLHSADPKLGMKRSELKNAASETGSFSFVFDSYARQITKDALSHYDLFLKIYERNLEKQLEVAPEKDTRALQQQIEAVKGITKGLLSPDVVQPGSQTAQFRARVANHTFENTLWGASSKLKG